MAEPRTVPCLGALDRAGTVQVIRRGREAILTVPPGESARLNHGQLVDLIAALTAARNEMSRAEP